MNKTKIVGLSILLIALFSTNCFAFTEELKVHKINKTISVEYAEQYKDNIEKEITIDDIKYELQDVKEQENREIISAEKEEIESVSFEITYKEVPQEEESTNYIPAVATAGAGVVVVSGIILWKRKKKNKIA